MLSIGMTPLLANAFLAGNLLHLLSFEEASNRHRNTVQALHVRYHNVTCYFRTINLHCCNN